jgi:hypothetical protein
MVADATPKPNTCRKQDATKRQDQRREESSQERSNHQGWLYRKTNPTNTPMRPKETMFNHHLIEILTNKLHHYGVVPK